jgi:hypothetical protein
MPAGQPAAVARRRDREGRRGATWVACPHAHARPTRRRLPGLASARARPGQHRALHRPVDQGQDRRPGGAGQRRAPGALRGAVAANALADRRLPRAARVAGAGSRRPGRQVTRVPRGTGSCALWGPHPLGYAGFSGGSTRPDQRGPVDRPTAVTGRVRPLPSTLHPAFARWYETVDPRPSGRTSWTVFVVFRAQRAVATPIFGGVRMHEDNRRKQHSDRSKTDGDHGDVASPTTAIRSLACHQADNHGHKSEQDSRNNRPIDDDHGNHAKCSAPKSPQGERICTARREVRFGVHSIPPYRGQRRRSNYREAADDTAMRTECCKPRRAVRNVPLPDGSAGRRRPPHDDEPVCPACRLSTRSDAHGYPPGFGTSRAPGNARSAPVGRRGWTSTAARRGPTKPGRRLRRHTKAVLPPPAVTRPTRLPVSRQRPDSLERRTSCGASSFIAHGVQRNGQRRVPSSGCGRGLPLDS